MISWDQTLLSLGASAVLAGLAYARAARVLRRQETLRGLRLRRDALDQVLAMLDGPAAEYLRAESEEYPQREMVELERRALQAQILFWRDLDLQEALRDITYPAKHAEAAAKLRRVLLGLEHEMRAAGERGPGGESSHSAIPDR